MVDVTVILGQDWKIFLSTPEDSKKTGKLDKLIDKARSILGRD